MSGKTFAIVKVARNGWGKQKRRNKKAGESVQSIGYSVIHMHISEGGHSN